MNYGTEISPAAVQAQITESKPQQEKVEKTKVEFDPKHYLQTNLEDGQTERTMQIRLLPITKDAQTPFLLVHAHYLKVPKTVSKNGWKRFICPVKNGFEDSIDKCPFCVIERDTLAAMKKEVKDSEAYKNLNSLAFQYKAKPMWLCRCIDRDHEDEGVKWWMFPHQERKNDGIIDKLDSIEKIARKQDPNYTIYSLRNGKDLFLTIKGTMTNGKMQKSITIVAGDQRTPISTNYEQAMKWINDPVLWTDVYKVKPYDYMSIIAEGGVPEFDKNLKKFVNIAAPGVNDEAVKEGINTPEEKAAEQEITNAIPVNEPKEPVTKFDPELNKAVQDLPF